ncbi:hypothetical protein [Gorillibacterium timonense]|uniref:hypothetical protein n=1 Tax=Gorillibacterium timonense TaxID=1689269 RepID=UPI0011DCA4EE|nr:hypothetical protein [Gorillibacterium timonense]
MFKIKKARIGITKEEEFDCSCCGSKENRVSVEASGVKSSCGSDKNTSCEAASNSCCGLEDVTSEQEPTGSNFKGTCGKSC